MLATSVSSWAAALAFAAAGPLAQTAAAVPAAVLVYFCLLRAFKVEERKLITGGRF